MTNSRPLYTVRVIIDRWDAENEEYRPLGEWPHALKEFSTQREAQAFMVKLPGWAGPADVLPIREETFDDSGT
jgi:hypothetical protein